MSLRQVQKQLDKQKQEEVNDPFELARQAAALDKPKKPMFSAFQMSDSEEEEEQENEQQNTTDQKESEPAKKKKKKNRKKKAKKPPTEDQLETQSKPTKQKKPTKEEDDDAFLDKLISQSKEESKRLKETGQYSGEDSIIKMDRKDFNYKRELKMLFQKSAHAYGAIGLEEDEKEERKEARAGNQDYEGYSKKMKRRLKMIERLQEKNRVLMSKKYLLVQPDPQWPRVEKLLTMEQIRTDKKTGQKVFSFIKTPEYVSLQKEFERVQGTMDIQMLMNFLQKNFYHHESLLYFADFLRIQGKFSDACHFLERCLFAFENAWTFDFQPVPPEKHNEGHSEFVPQTRMDLEKEHLNKVFCECLVKYIDVLGRKGCSRTALEYCKLLLSLSPEQDPYGVLLRMDYYADRAREYGYLQDFVREFPKEVYPEEPLASLLIMPNLLMTTALAGFEQQGERAKLDLEKTLGQVMDLDKHLNELLDLPPEALVITAVILYPGLIEALIRKAGQKQINAVVKKSHFSGWQSKNWTEILTHGIFVNEGENDYQWVLSEKEVGSNNEEKQQEMVEETMSKFYQIFVARSAALFNPDHVLLWMKEVIGFTLNKIDEGVVDRDLFVVKISSMTQSPFALSRYRSLKVSDFTDDVTTINPNELMMGGAGGGQGEVNDPQMQAEANMAAQQLQHMINQLNRPQAQNMPLIQQRNVDNMNEQELIAMQEALLAQMGDEEQLHFDDDDSGDDQPANPNGGGGLLNYLAGMMPSWGSGNRNQEEEKKGGEEDKKQN